MKSSLILNVFVFFTALVMFAQTSYGAIGFAHDPYSPKGRQLCYVYDPVKDARSLLENNISCCLWEGITLFCDQQPELFKKAVQKKSDGPLLIAMMIAQLNKKRCGEVAAFQKILAATDSEDLNSYDQTGQTIAHKMTPFHWRTDLILPMFEKGVRFDIGTREPDRYPGSTIAHNVAGMFSTKKNKLKKVIYQMHKYNAVDFLCWLYQKYPDIKDHVSKGRDGHFKTPSALMLDEIKEAVNRRLLSV